MTLFMGNATAKSVDHLYFLSLNDYEFEFKFKRKTVKSVVISSNNVVVSLN